MTKCFFIISAGFMVFMSETLFAEDKHLPLEKIKLPPGFHIEIYAEDVPNARAMAIGDKGTIFAGSFKAGNVYAVLDRDQDQKADAVLTIASNLRMPVGVAFHEGDLYVSAVSRIYRFDNIEERLWDPPEPVLITDQYPGDAGHGWKFIAFGPDGKLYVPQGVPCNVCELNDERYGTITRIHRDGTGFEIVARGVRNSVGFDWHPETGELWFTDNGRDWMGDDLPPDELNRLTREGLHFGFPYCHGNSISDPEYGIKRRCNEFAAPVQELAPHTASLGMRFYTGSMFPKEYRHQIFIAEHGSWNRSVPMGYRVTLVKLRGQEPVGYEPFADGWLEGSSAWGRPVDVLVMPDGALLVSDDHAGVIYRIYYGQKRKDT